MEYSIKNNPDPFDDTVVRKRIVDVNAKIIKKIILFQEEGYLMKTFEQKIMKLYGEKGRQW